ncbi:hypothetical protein [uncultured Gemmiger sp.]|uniref:hypothetical protein n=1 Tax=uncultured Gemmiger sp. TaxID=1623490 RepID=UPI0025F439C5|nr:hypothetical protein [uncultured Gemmiger sp.]
MNKFKKLVAVLVSVVMACVFATGVFATDYVDDLSAARAEVNGYLTSAGVYGMDGVVNSLNESQLRALRDNSVALRNALTQAKNALNGAKSEADVRTAVSTALSQVGGIFRDAGISLNIDVVASGSEVAVVPTASANGVSGTTQWKYATDGSVASASNPLTASSSAVIKATGDNSAMVIATIVLSVVGVLGLAVRKESALAL